MTKTKSILASTVLTGALVMQGALINAQNGPNINGSSIEAIHPFHFHASQADLDDLHRRILATRWPEKELVNDQTQGVPNSLTGAIFTTSKWSCWILLCS
jgi:hypothetical protein